MTKILMLNGSHRSGGNTEVLLEVMKKEFEMESMFVESISLALTSLKHCKVCDNCATRPLCNINDDDFNSILGKILEVDVLVIGTPVYVGMPSSKIIAFIQRLTYLSMLNDQLLKNKIGAAVIVAGEAGHLTALNSIVDFFLVNGMIVPGSRYWPVGTASKKREIINDTSALENISCLSQNIVKLLKRGSINETRR